jgi:general secretion pathway protein I
MFVDRVPNVLKNRRAKRTEGFTLIELLVALTVLAFALAAIVQSAGVFAEQAGYLRERTLAHWVGMNTLTEWQITRKWPALGTLNGEEELAGRMWRWHMIISETMMPTMRRMQVEVRPGSESSSASPSSEDNADQPLARLEGYLVQP